MKCDRVPWEITEDDCPVASTGSFLTGALELHLSLRNSLVEE